MVCLVSDGVFVVLWYGYLLMGNLMLLSLMLSVLSVLSISDYLEGEWGGYVRCVERSECE